MSSLLVDVGGTDIKLGVTRIGCSNLKLIKRYRMPNLTQENAYRAEISQEQILRTLIPLIKSVLKSESRISKILVSGQMGCWTLDGFPPLEGRIVSWQDQRVLEMHKNLQEVISNFKLEEIVQSNGNEIGPGVPLVGLISTLRESQEMNQKSRFQSLISWLVGKLTSIDLAPMHITDAASSGLVNLESHGWNEMLFTQFSKIWFPEIIETVSPIGYFGGTEIEVYCGIGDQQASLLGAGISEDSIVLNIGTGGQVATLLDFTDGSNVKRRPFFDGKNLYTVTHLLSGRFLNKVIEVVSSESRELLTYEALNIVSVPSGARVPILDANLALNYEYLKEMARDLGSDRFLQSVIHTMACNYVSAIDELGGVRGRKLIFAGGVGQKNAALANVILRELDYPAYEISPEVETTLGGLRIIADGI